ncbi:hypothetical protein B0H13DRAFT_1875830 [Mycena leptocephala]|nr:hypothetical protein B0H13DRAFT_1875830 [Mycena leptocephala]
MSVPIPLLNADEPKYSRNKCKNITQLASSESITVDLLLAKRKISQIRKVVKMVIALPFPRKLTCLRHTKIHAFRAADLMSLLVRRQSINDRKWYEGLSSRPRTSERVGDARSQDKSQAKTKSKRGTYGKKKGFTKKKRKKKDVVATHSFGNESKGFFGKLARELSWGAEKVVIAFPGVFDRDVVRMKITREQAIVKKSQVNYTRSKTLGTLSE